MSPGPETDCRNRDSRPRIRRLDLPIAVYGMSPQPAGCGEDGADVRFPTPFDLKACLAWVADRLARRDASGSGPAPPGAPPTAPDEIPIQHLEIVRRVLDFIERHHREGTRLAAIALAAGVSRSHLCRIFKRVTGLSLKRFLTHRRLQAAKALLREPGVTIHQVASRVGYRDASHFDRVFRQWEGQTPSGYRRQVVRQTIRIGALPTDYLDLRSSFPASR